MSSEKIGIIGVGEGSTEHWRIFQDLVGIRADDMVKNADITHKYGIRYENWTNHTPDYFHSVGGTGLNVNTFFGSYAYALENELLLTNTFSWKGLVDDKIVDLGSNTHLGCNQYHFDTFKLNNNMSLNNKLISNFNKLIEETQYVIDYLTFTKYNEDIINTYGYKLRAFKSAVSIIEKYPYKILNITLT